MTDETGWEFETMKRVYANVGVDRQGRTTGVVWQIVEQAPGSTALLGEETRVEKLSFAIEPRDGRQFTIQARMRYHYAPEPEHGSGHKAEATLMAAEVITLPGKRPS